MPRRVLFLSGAPGSGKGSSLQAIQQATGITRAVTVSDLLHNCPTAQDLMRRGEMVSDEIVYDTLLTQLLCRHGGAQLGSSAAQPLDPAAGIIVDGFPRTAGQIEALPRLQQEMREMCCGFGGDAAGSPGPVFEHLVLMVDEDLSISRQQARGAAALAHNAAVLEQGNGDLQNVRSTDLEEFICRKRHAEYAKNEDAILRLSAEGNVVHPVDASGDRDATAKLIKELFASQGAPSAAYAGL